MNSQEAIMVASAMADLRTCRCCGQIQIMPVVPARMRAVCGRCGTTMRLRRPSHAADAAAIALAALILYPFAVALPMLQIEQFGHQTQTSVLGGIAALFGGSQYVIGVIVLLCSVIFPLGKLIAILALSWKGLGLGHRHKAVTHRIVEWTGRWGMLDVLLVAILVAALKLGNVMDVAPGPAAAAFAVCVVLSILATAMFDPHGLWEGDE